MRGSLGGSFSQDSQYETNSDFSSPALPPSSNYGFDSEPFMEGLAEPGYTHEYRKYSRQYIIEVCNGMDDRVKPESYEKCEKNDVALFRSSPCKDWAPLPTPMTTFASNFFDNERKGSSAQEGGEGKQGARDRKASWGPQGHRGSRSESHDYEESNWQTGGDDTWWTGTGGTESKRRSSSKSWGEQGKSTRGDQDKSSWNAGYGEQKQWVKKEDKAKAEQEADWG